MNEKYYIKRIKKGDHDALDAFIEELYPHVYTFIKYKVQDIHLAYDLTQDVFVRFIRALPTYKSEGKVLNYLYKISSHVCLTYWKRHKEELTLIDEILEDGEMNVHEAMIKQFTHEQLEQAIYHLKPELQDIIILKYFHQYTFKEISYIYHIPISTIKTRHYNALKQLKKILERSQDYEPTFTRN